MDLHLKNKVVLVTGGASGIGATLVHSFANEGATVVFADKAQDKGEDLERTMRRDNHSCRFVATELTNERDVQGLTAIIEQEFGSLSVVVNNAAVNDGAGIDDGVEAFRRSLEVNLVAPYSVVHHMRTLLRQSAGVIINIGSKVAETGQGGTNGYAASKGGLNALTREWATELAAEGVRVNTVIPAEVWTPQYDSWLKSHSSSPDLARKEIDALVPLGRRMTTTQEVADTVVFLASDRASHITGQIIFVDGGYSHLDRALSVNKKHI